MKRILSLFLTSLFLVSAVQAKDLRFAQISDIRYSESNSETLKAVINDINNTKNVKFTVFTGDNINKPSVSELESFLKEAKRLKMPFYIVLGDKDVNKLKHLSKAEYIEIIKKNVRKYKPETPNYTFEKDGVIFIVADGSKDVIPSTNGYYRDDVLTILDTELSKYPDKNVIILQHFPVIPPSNKESHYTFKAENYIDVLKKHNNVRAIISGHFGVNSEQNNNGIVHISTAATPYYRIIDILDCDTPNPTIWAQLNEAR